MVAWLNGTLVETPQISALDRGFTLGDGLFETMAVFDGHARHLARHHARLAEGCALLGFPVPSQETITTAIAALAADTGLTRAVMRLTLSRGPGARGLLPPDPATPTLLLTASPFPSPLPPARVIVAASTRRNEHSPLSRLKTLNYLEGIVARREAAARGADDAILLSTSGRVSDSTVATVLARGDNGRLWTPPLTDGALAGVARGLLLTAGLIEERPLDAPTLETTPEVFLVNALGVRLVRCLDGRTLSPSPPLLNRLMLALEEGSGEALASPGRGFQGAAAP